MLFESLKNQLGKVKVVGLCMPDAATQLYIGKYKKNGQTFNVIVSKSRWRDVGTWFFLHDENWQYNGGSGRHIIGISELTEKQRLLKKDAEVLAKQLREVREQQKAA